ncbi:MAG: molecular chaperone TorD family protein [Planctomycetes bacterium]|nr:molecular chaperone TorD family protein [Planctomycetota bacterium]
MTDASPDERQALRSSAELVGLLLLRELDAPLLARLRAEPVASALAEAGVALPAPAEEAAWLEERAADYHDRFLGPRSAPLVQSLWAEGRFEGEPAVRVRALARAAALEYDREAARGAPHDHLGALLLLWAAADERAPAVARVLAAEHLAWADAPLERLARTSGLYAALAALARGLVRELTVAAPA